MKKPKTVSQLKKIADTEFSKYVRLRDSDRNGNVKCITCSKIMPWKQAQNGHFVSRRVNALRYDDENCNGQCYSCNVMRYGEQFEYAQALDKKYGKGTADALHARRHESHQFKAQELLDIIAEAKENCRAHNNFH